MKKFLNNQLIKACGSNNRFLAKMCLTFGADVNVKNDYGSTALTIAAVNDCKEIVELLLAAGADVNVSLKNNSDITALIAASINGRKEIVELLLAKGADVNVRNKWGSTALIRAAHNGNKEVVGLLKQYEAKENNINKQRGEMNKLPTQPHIIKLFNGIFNSNKDFIDGHDESYYKEFKKIQSPHTTYVGCCDSRVHLNSFNDNPKNEIFSIRNIGNQLATAQGSVDYGVNVLNTKFLMIVGHTDCGAIRAVVAGTETGMPEVDRELVTININSTDLNTAIIQNVNNQVGIALERYYDKVESDKLIVFGMVYDFSNCFGLGYGKIILVNVNGESKGKKLSNAYKKEVSNINIFEKSL